MRKDSVAAMQVDRYLERIFYDGERTPTAETLRAIHRAHMLSVPFENLDIHLGVPINLSVPAFYEKIVVHRRGGFCYELNGLLAWLLAELGFSVSLLSARVFNSGTLSPEFDHVLLWVECDGPWIADVGFGDSSLNPLRGEPGVDDDRDGEDFRVTAAGDAWTVERRRAGGWEPQYVFTRTPHRLEEFGDRCLFQQTSPDSHFTRNTVCSRAITAGRITLSGNKLILTFKDGRQEDEVGSAEEYRSILATMFGIRLAKRDAECLSERVLDPARLGPLK